MIRTVNRLGTVAISQGYFANLVGHAASECFGVAGMAVSSPVQSLRSKLLKKKEADQGVSVRVTSAGLVVDLHIIVTYGVNIAAIVKSIVHKVRYTVEEATGMTVAKVNVYVDSMKAE